MTVSEGISHWFAPTPIYQLQQTPCNNNKKNCRTINHLGFRNHFKETWSNRHNPCTMRTLPNLLKFVWTHSKRSRHFYLWPTVCIVHFRLLLWTSCGRCCKFFSRPLKTNFCLWQISIPLALSLLGLKITKHDE